MTRVYEALVLYLFPMATDDQPKNGGVYLFTLQMVCLYELIISLSVAILGGVTGMLIFFLFLLKERIMPRYQAFSSLLINFWLQQDFLFE